MDTGSYQALHVRASKDQQPGAERKIGPLHIYEILILTLFAVTVVLAIAHQVAVRNAYKKSPMAQAMAAAKDA